MTRLKFATLLALSPAAAYGALRPPSSPSLHAIAILSLNAAGVQGNGDSWCPEFTPDGKTVVFYSNASNMYANDTNATTDVVAKVLGNRHVNLLSHGVAMPNLPTSDNTQLLLTHPGISASGNTAIFWATDAAGLVANDTNGFVDIFVAQKPKNTISIVSNGYAAPANGSSYFPVISKDGTKIAFTSYANNLVPGYANKFPEIYVRNLATNQVIVASAPPTGLASGGSAIPTFSPDGTKIAFFSLAQNLWPGTVPLISQVFLRDLTSGALSLVSSDALGDLGNGPSTHPSYAADGNNVIFQSTSTNLGPVATAGVLNVFVKNLVTGAVQIVSSDVNGISGNGDSSHGAMSPDGTRVAFQSVATNFAPGVPPGSSEIYVKNLITGIVSLVTVNISAAPSLGNANHPRWSPDGTLLVFDSSASDLVSVDTNRSLDVFEAPAPQ